MTGFVSFVGAGPGDPELLILKMLARLVKADVMLFDDLAKEIGSAPAMILYGPLRDEA